ncbi:FAD-binding oxidoreductase [Streptomyces albicerus]|uniref:FAD-binding oxidoreductase n=1 Tax=Streptomyces albicerus TaxID=2569859 RepID=UPI001CED7EBE|nr:FAD-binding oxidoreductase [Streptomyces albicerus]
MTQYAMTEYDAAVSPGSVRRLGERLAGPVFVPGDPGYAEEAEAFDRSVRHRPALIVGAANATDVVTAVRFARDHGLGVAVQATGHGVALPADDTALLVSTRRMNGHSVDPERRTVRLEAGALWQDVIPTAARHGLAPLNGSAPFIGAVSYTLGGGIGVMSRRHGYAADHVRRIEVVTADGEPRTATEEENPDLFWALRGGKGNFGVVTALEADLFEVSRLYGGGLFFPAESIREVLHRYRTWVTEVPDELSSSFFMMPWPDAPGVPEELRGRFALHVRLCYLGPPDEGARLIRPLREIATPLLDTVTDIPYTEVGTIHNDPPIPGSYHINNFQLTHLDHDAVEAILKLAGPEADGAVGIEIRHLGGALARPPRVPNAVARPTARFQLYSAGVLGIGDDEAVHAGHDLVVDTLSPWNSGMRALNFMAGVAHTDPEDVRQAFTAETYARLVALKSAYDPGNMFRFNHNIPPYSAP